MEDVSPVLRKSDLVEVSLGDVDHNAVTIASIPSGDTSYAVRFGLFKILESALLSGQDEESRVELRGEKRTS